MWFDKWCFEFQLYKHAALEVEKMALFLHERTPKKTVKRRDIISIGCSPFYFFFVGFVGSKNVFIYLQAGNISLGFEIRSLNLSSG